MMRVCHGVSVACRPRPRRAGDAAKSGRSIGQFSYCTGDTVGVRGLNAPNFGSWGVI